ncbi:putative Heavy-metal-binding-domain-containing protein [Seiridium cardinale]|uniref:Heavy-metal-binding-domain-containing protein n=1 Tax=Seiridium cardinale TaxID=138064 RepID=A0ABR2XX84_9PEZI
MEAAVALAGIGASSAALGGSSAALSGAAAAKEREARQQEQHLLSARSRRRRGTTPPPKFLVQSHNRTATMPFQQTQGVQASDRADALSTPNTAVLTSTLYEVPGHDIVKTFGTVHGFSVRHASRGYTRWVASTVGIGRGRVPSGRTELLYLIRDDAMDALVSEASRMGANAVIAIRFESETLS